MNGDGIADGLHARMQRLRPFLQQVTPVEVEGEARFVLFFSFTDSTSRATTLTVSEPTLESAWQAGISRVAASGVDARWLRVDWVDAVERRNWKDLKSALSNIKRNYFRLGLSLDPAFRHAFLETELNANAMLYGGSREPSAVLNENNFRIYARKRHGLTRLAFADDDPVWVFNTRGCFIGEDLQGHDLSGAGLDTGRRVVHELDPDGVGRLLHAGGSYLASQVRADGRFNYGWHPCFDRPIKAYNALRHASTLYAMLETWEITRSTDLGRAIGRARRCLMEELTLPAGLPTGGEASFLVDTGGEIKLGGNAVAILALLKHHELTGADDSIALASRLGAGILFMQDANSGRFTHVLHYPSLQEKERFRIIYYDGEAAFALIRLYEATGDTAWLAAVKKAFDHFIDSEHWRSHDHWLGYCVNGLTRYRKKDRYFRFGLDNVRGHLDFVLERITTFPTLLELMTAAESMIARLRADPARRHLLEGFDLARFYQALHFRAHYLLNGHFWPELAMFYARPRKIAGSFFIRHHAFRVRIDDVEHYLSGLVAYRRYLLACDSEGGEVHRTPAPRLGRHWSATDVERATGGRWTRPPQSGWSANGLCMSGAAMRAGDMVALRPQQGFAGGVPASELPALRGAAAIVTSEPPAPGSPDVSCLAVADVGSAILDLGSYARRQMSGAVIGVIDTAGSADIVPDMVRALQAYGPVGAMPAGKRSPHAIASGLASIPWDAKHIVLGLGPGRLARKARLIRPNIAVLTDIPARDAAYHADLSNTADSRTMIFHAMRPGAAAVLHREMDDWEHVYLAARSRGLRVIHYGRSAGCDLQLVEYDGRLGCWRARIETSDVDFAIGAACQHAALSVLAVLGTVWAQGRDLQPALARLGCSGPAPEKAGWWRGRRHTHQRDREMRTPSPAAAAGV